VTYLSELRSSLVDAAHRQHAEQERGGAQRVHHGQPAARARSARVRSFSKELRRGSLHGGRAILASVALGLTGTAVGAVQVGPPLGPEPQLSAPLTKAAGSPPPREPRP
jgi:hypothetical protein